MSVGPWLDPSRPVFLPDPVNRHHPLNQVRAGWWLALPGIDGGRQLFDLVGLAPGVLTNTASAATSGWKPTARPGGWGHILYDGTNDYTAIPDVPALNIAGAVTIAAWVKTAGTSGIIFGGFKATSPFNGYGIRHSITTNKFAYWGGSTWSDSTATINDGLWHRALVSASATVTAFYFDGVAAGTAAAQTPAAFAGTRAIGAAGDGASGYLAGSIDDVAVWSRALSAAEAWADYDLSRRGYPGVLNRIRSRVAVLMGASGGAASPHLLGLMGVGK